MNNNETIIANETIVAVFDTEADATAAVSELANAGVSREAITQHAKNSMTRGVETSAAPVREPGFWERLFGGEPDRAHDTTVYNRSLENGATVVTVQVEEPYVTKVMTILERHDPIDIDERGAGYVDIAPISQPGGSKNTPAVAADPTRKASLQKDFPAERSKDEQTMQLAEETLAVGKRVINRGTTRVRRYVVETPIEQQVNLRSESVSIERRPVADDRPVTDASFTDKVVEVTETDEEPVISKQARIKEEVVIHKDATDRTETVRDTVRREEAEVTKDTADGSAARSITARPTIDAEVPKR
jgi:uncharacterized protein (TIGR02271 family)